VDGILRTRVGYAGGTSLDPTYRTIGDHSECIQVDFDPAAVTYPELLTEFFAIHDPSRPAHRRQYASAVFYSNDAQRQAAEEIMETLTPRFGRPLQTRVEPLDAFYNAEDYHQKYALRANPVLNAEIQERYRTQVDLRDSTLAARLNGYAYGGADRVLREIESYSLSAAAEAHLRDLVR
jgi:peptide-methionine (S)-S-oxide reductase